MAYKRISPIPVGDGGTGARTFTANGVLYGNGTSAIAATAAGTTGQVLTSNGSGSAPTYQTGPTGANLFLIQSQTASNSALLAFTTGITATYDTYFLVWSDVVPQSNSAVLQLQFSTDGGATYVTSGYTSGINFAAYNTATLTNSNSTSVILLSDSISVTSGEGANGNCYMYDLTNTNISSITGQVCFRGATTGSGTYGYLVAGTGPTSVNAFKVFMSSGLNIATGTFSLYGILE